MSIKSFLMQFISRYLPSHYSLEEPEPTRIAIVENVSQFDAMGNIHDWYGKLHECHLRTIHDAFMLMEPQTMEMALWRDHVLQSCKIHITNWSEP